MTDQEEKDLEFFKKFSGSLSEELKVEASSNYSILGSKYSDAIACGLLTAAAGLVRAVNVSLRKALDED